MSSLIQPPSSLDSSKISQPFCLKKKLKIGSAAEKLYETFKKNGFSCFIVGGFVRNALLGEKVTDLDFATNAEPEQMLKMFPKAIPTGIAYGTLTIFIEGESFEVTTFRSEFLSKNSPHVVLTDESEEKSVEETTKEVPTFHLASVYSDFRRPDKVFFTKSLREDVIRRDFTVNALAYDIGREEIIDYVGGLKDLAAKKLRVIGSASERFGEDALRMMRACRFVAQLGFSVDLQTKNALKQHHGLIKHIAYERIQVELSKLLLGKKPSAGVEMMRHSGLLEIILPEVHAAIGFEQNSFHGFDVYQHTLHVIDRCVEKCGGVETNLLEVTLAGLFHDVGKVQTRGFSPQTKEYTFYGHERVSADLAKKSLKQLRYPQRLIKSVVHLINQHMIQYQCDWTDAAVRRFIRRVGHENLSSLFFLARADRFGKYAKKNPDDEKDLLLLEKRIDEQLKKSHVFSVKDLNVGGHDLMNALNIEPSSVVGNLLKDLLEFVLDDPQKNQKHSLIQQAKVVFAKRYKNYE